jgi:hypothetical protein
VQVHPVAVVPGPGPLHGALGHDLGIGPDLPRPDRRGDAGPLAPPVVSAGRDDAVAVAGEVVDGVAKFRQRLGLLDLRRQAITDA